MGITNSKPAPAKTVPITVSKKTKLSVHGQMVNAIRLRFGYLSKEEQILAERILSEWLYNTIWTRTGKNLSCEEKGKWVSAKMVTLGFAPNTPLPRGSLEKETQKACLDLFAHLVEENKEALEKL